MRCVNTVYRLTGFVGISCRAVALQALPLEPDLRKGVEYYVDGYMYITYCIQRLVNGSPIDFQSPHSHTIWIVPSTLIATTVSVSVGGRKIPREPLWL
jgi:hypothetical protein